MRKKPTTIAGFIPPPKRLVMRIASSTLSVWMRSAQAIAGASAAIQMTATSAAAASNTKASIQRTRTRSARATCHGSRQPADQSTSASAKTPIRHQKATSPIAASRPRNESSSTPRDALQQRRLMETIGDGQKTERASSTTKAVEARRRLPSIDIEPLSDHPHLVDLAVAGERRRDLAGVRARGDDHLRLRARQRLRRGVDHALQRSREVARPEVRRGAERDPLRLHTRRPQHP